MTYLAWAHSRKRTAALAESDDGLHWSPLDTTREIDLPERILANQVLPLLERRIAESISGRLSRISPL